ncbi:ATP-binding protein [Candidatus Bathyarchaeota archaeon]|nr:ATP-binding protein [Candidatus Bathyarchaeota archaeon]
MSETGKHDKANPFSTSGSGVTFEQSVGVYYLVSLLAKEIPRGLDRGVCTEVRFQQRFSGCLLDDIVVIASDECEEKKLALQVKHNLIFSDSSTNEEFARVIGDCWKTFTSSMGWKFNQETDRLGIGLGIHQSKVDKHFKPLSEWARTSKDSAEFMYKVSSTIFSSNEKRKYLQIIKNLLTKTKGAAITDDEIWRFLKCLVVINFDLENAGSSDITYCQNRLLNQLKNRDEDSAKSLFDTLCYIVKTYARSAGSINIKILRNQMPEDILLEDAPNCALDLARLRKHSDMVLDSISDSIGLKVRLPRNEKIDELEAAIKENEVVVISGEPMVGKSVLLKLFANRLRSEGDVFVFSVGRFQYGTLDNFLRSIHVQNDLDTLLYSVGSAPIRCILVDGLERAIDEDKRRILKDLILAVRKYNDTILTHGGHKQNC